MSREDLIKRVADAHDTHLAYESPETITGAVLFTKDLDPKLMNDICNYVVCNVTVGELRTWLARDGAQMRLGGAYQDPPAPK